MTAENDSLVRGARDRGVDADAPHDLAVDRGLNVGGGARVAALAHRVLGVVQDAHVKIELVQRRDERVDRACTRSLHLNDLAVIHERRLELDALIVHGRHLRGTHLEAAPRLQAGSGARRQVLVREDLPQRSRVDLAAVGIRVALDDTGELHLEGGAAAPRACAVDMR